MRRRGPLAFLTVSVLATAAPDTILPANVPPPVVRTLQTADSALPPLVKKDSLSNDTVRQDTTLRRPATAARDSVVKKSIPKRILTFKEQLFYALIFMSYLAAMMAITSNYNP